MSPLTTDTCPRCGERMVPQLDPQHRPDSTGPLSVEPPVRLTCTHCPPPDL